MKLINSYVDAFKGDFRHSEIKVSGRDTLNKKLLRVFVHIQVTLKENCLS